MNKQNGFEMIADFNDDPNILTNKYEAGDYPILCTRTLMAFPSVVTPIMIGRKASIKVIRHLEKKYDDVFCIFAQKDESVDNPTAEDLYPIGAVVPLMESYHYKELVDVVMNSMKEAKKQNCLSKQQKMQPKDT